MIRAAHHRTALHLPLLRCALRRVVLRVSFGERDGGYGQKRDHHKHRNDLFHCLYLLSFCHGNNPVFYDSVIQECALFPFDRLILPPGDLRNIEETKYFDQSQTNHGKPGTLSDMSCMPGQIGSLYK